MTINVSPILSPSLQSQQYGRNGQVAPAIAATAIARATNQMLRLCGKELFVSPPGITAASSAGVGPTSIWRSYIHTSPRCARIRWYMSLQRPSSGSTGDPRAILELQDTGGSVLDDATVYWGYGTAVNTSTWREFTGTIDVDGDTDYLLHFAVADNGRLANALVIEESEEPDVGNGYIADSYSAASKIYDDLRAGVQDALYDQYRRGKAVVLDWQGTVANSTTTDKNIIDGSSTSVSASTPGFTLDMSKKARLKDSSTGVNCKVKAYGFVDSGSNGFVYVKNSAGTVLATVTGFGVAGSWRSADLVLPATKAKYDIMIDNSGGVNFQLNALKIYEYET